MKSVEWHSYRYRIKRLLLKALSWKTKRMAHILKHYGLISESGNTIKLRGMRWNIDAVIIRSTYKSTYMEMYIIVTNLENERRV